MTKTVDKCPFCKRVKNLLKSNNPIVAPICEDCINEQKSSFRDDNYHRIRHCFRNTVARARQESPKVYLISLVRCRCHPRASHRRGR